MTETMDRILRHDLGMVVLGLVLSTAAGQKAPNLVDKSRAVCATKGWYGVTKGTADHHWVGNSQILYIVPKPDGSNDLKLFSVDTGQTKSAPLAEAFRQSVGEPESVKVSPDGQKMFWSGKNVAEPSWFVANMSAKSVETFPRRLVDMSADAPTPDEESTLTWSPDSRSVLECVITFGRNTATSVWRRTLGAIATEQAYPKARGYADWQPTMIGTWLAFAPSGISIGGPRKSVGFNTWKVDQPATTRKSWNVKVPANRTIAGFSHSFSGKQILWDLSIHNDKHSGPWDSAGEEIWITDAEGKNWKQIAQVVFDEKKGDEQVTRFGLPKWRPDGKAISFDYMGKLYIFKLPSQ